MGRHRLLPSIVLFFAITASNPALAATGEIALIEDAGGISNSLMPQGYLAKAACAFYKANPDSYDALVFFSTMPLNLLNATPAGWAVKSPAKGLGLDLWPDQSKAFCSPRLRHAIRMGELAKLPDSPDGLYSGGYASSYSGIEILGHEMGHQWLALVTFDKGDGKRRCLLRAFAPGSATTGDCDGYSVSDFGPHWSYYFNSRSVMFGSTIEDLGGGKFRISKGTIKYSPLDQYLMGLRAKQDVPKLFLVEKGDPATNGSQKPPQLPGQSEEVSGTRLDFTVDDVIRAEGPRVPATEGCHWKTAFAIIHAPGKPPGAAQVAKVEAYRQRWETFYAWATDGRGSVDTTLAGTGQGTPGCPSSGIQPDAGPGPADAAIADVEPAADSQTSPADLTPSGDAPPPSTDDGCSCRVGFGHPSSGGGPLALSLLALVLAWREGLRRRVLSRRGRGSPGPADPG